jgi:pyrroloquinoline quinone biosynthesis protein E
VSVPQPQIGPRVAPQPGPPLWLLCELTYRCPLHCVFCYNPVDFSTTGTELTTDEWLRVLREARAAGAVQLGLSGGEPLVRDDVEIIVAAAHDLGFYINLITSGVGLTEARLAALKRAGLDHIQLSFQDSTRKMNDFLSSTRTFELKSKVAALIKKYDYPMVLNVVLHRLNIDHVEEILAMAKTMEADYAVLRLGIQESRAAPAEPRAGCARGSRDAALSRRERRPHAYFFRGARLLRAPLRLALSYDRA